MSTLPKVTVLFCLIALVCSCSTDDGGASTPPPIDTEREYLFLGHIYDHHRANNLVDERIENLNLDPYDEIWLGGDVCSATTQMQATLTYLDDIFDLSAPTTHWATGNHDIRYGRPEWIEAATKRPLYYSHHQNGITRIVMNTNIRDTLFREDCDYVNGQVDMIDQVLDTIGQSSHLIILMHFIMWLDCEEGMEENSAHNANASYISLTCEPGNQFHWYLYPRLQEVQSRGVQVIVVSGDSGQYGKKYEYTTQDGIQFFMSGINNSINMENPVLVERFNTDPDSILIFHHDLESRELLGKFYKLNDL